jgi:hypothetical protein
MVFVVLIHLQVRRFKMASFLRCGKIDNLLLSERGKHGTIECTSMHPCPKKPSEKQQEFNNFCLRPTKKAYVEGAA